MPFVLASCIQHNAFKVAWLWYLCQRLAERLAHSKCSVSVAFINAKGSEATALPTSQLQLSSWDLGGTLPALLLKGTPGPYELGELEGSTEGYEDTGFCQSPTLK